MLVVDGLECSNYDREVLLDLRTGGVGCVTVTLAFWEDALETMENIARWRDLERDNEDLVEIAGSVADVERIHAAGKTAIVFGAQNTSPFNERLRFVELFWQMGLRVCQLTYNNQNAYGGSCYEQADSGLSRFGRELVEEMNRVGMLVDLSHVGERTGLDVIEHSSVPVAVTHANPASVFAHPRNKGDELLKALAEREGVLGLAAYRNITGPFAESADKWAELVERAVEILGVEHVGIGTDLSAKTGQPELDWMRKGRWTRRTQYGAGTPQRPGKQPPPEWLASVADFPNIKDALVRRGFAEPDVEAVMGGNWMRLYGQVFGG